MAGPATAEDDYEDIGYIAPPTQPAPAGRYDTDIPSLPPLDLNDLLDSTQSSSASSSASTTAALARSLLVVWQNELHSPSLLTYQFALVRELQAVLGNRQAALDNPSESALGPHPFSGASPWQLNLYQLELDRLQYVLVDYHRVRLTKIQAAPIHLTMHLTEQAGARRPEQLSADEVEQLLDVSQAELAFLLGYVDIWERVMRSEYLDKMPAVAGSERTKQLLGAGGREMVKQYDTDWFVMLRVQEGDGRERVMMDDIEVELREGEIWLVRFEPFKQLLNDGKVQLI